MFKNMIAPVQAWLLSQNRCVGCGNPLNIGKRIKLKDNEDEVTCKKCPRIYIYNHQTKRYFRAPLSKKTS